MSKYGQLYSHMGSLIYLVCDLPINPGPPHLPRSFRSITPVARSTYNPWICFYFSWRFPSSHRTLWIIRLLRKLLRRRRTNRHWSAATTACEVSCDWSAIVNFYNVNCHWPTTHTISSQVSCDWSATVKVT